MAKKLPAFQFYPGDWMKDPSLSMCSPATRGIWIDAICAMHELRGGTLSGSDGQLARLLRCTTSELRSAIDELQATNAADIKEHEDGTFQLISRRLTRDANTREIDRLRKQGKRSPGKFRDVSGKSPPLSSSSTSISTTTTNKNIRPTDQPCPDVVCGGENSSKADLKIPSYMIEGANKLGIDPDSFARAYETFPEDAIRSVDLLEEAGSKVRSPMGFFNAMLKDPTKKPSTTNGSKQWRKDKSSQQKNERLKFLRQMANDPNYFESVNKSLKRDRKKTFSKSSIIKEIQTLENNATTSPK